MNLVILYILWLEHPIISSTNQNLHHSSISWCNGRFSWSMLTMYLLSSLSIQYSNLSSSFFFRHCHTVATGSKPFVNKKPNIIRINVSYTFSIKNQIAEIIMIHVWLLKFYSWQMQTTINAVLEFECYNKSHLVKMKFIKFQKPHLPIIIQVHLQPWFDWCIWR